MRDFTLLSYSSLLDALIRSGYQFQTFRDYLSNPFDRSVVLRHDVDKTPHNSLVTAQIEAGKGIHASYFFRIVKASFVPHIISSIAGLGHEIGYHYEDMALCKGDVDAAYRSFTQNLASLRKLQPITTACMHGSPLSKYDNRLIWDKYNYQESGILGEPYFDVDFSKTLYITDTGRKWNNKDVSVRDKVKSTIDIKIMSTWHMIDLISKNNLPSQIMINTHPQRWTDKLGAWLMELVSQNAKNHIKRLIVRKKVSTLTQHSDNEPLGNKSF